MERMLPSKKKKKKLGEQLLAYKAVLTGIAIFKTDLDALQQSLDAQPDQDHSHSLSDLHTLFSALREQWVTADLNTDNPVKAELDACKRSLTAMQRDVSAAKARSDSASSTSSASSGHPTPHYSPHPYSELPKIKVPTFNGDLMGWSTFWSTFKTTVEDRKDLTNSQRLNYLRQAIKDPSLQMLLNSPIETADTYLDVVQELKERFQKTREIHRTITKTLTDLTTPKLTRADLRLLFDTIKCSIANLKATKHYTIEAFLSSMVYSILPSKLQILWDQATQNDKGVPEITQLLSFIKDHAETLPVSSTPPAVEKTSDSAKKPYHKKKESYQNPKGMVHVVSLANTYKWECSLCKLDKHPLHVCPKWSNFNLAQRLGHIQAKGLCSNCLSGGHFTSACKSTYRCRECSQMHHTSIHQVPAPAPINYSSTLCQTRL